MSKAHFEALARALKESKIEGHGLNSASTKYVNEQWEFCVCRIADVCAVSNVSFKRSAFYDACGYKR